MYSSKVEYDKDTDEYFIILPDKLCEEMNIIPGDLMTWTVDDDKVTLCKNNS